MTRLYCSISVCYWADRYWVKDNASLKLSLVDLISSERSGCGQHVWTSKQKQWCNNTCKQFLMAGLNPCAAHIRLLNQLKYDAVQYEVKFHYVYSLRIGSRRSLRQLSHLSRTKISCKAETCMHMRMLSLRILIDRTLSHKRIVMSWMVRNLLHHQLWVHYVKEQC